MCKATCQAAGSASSILCYNPLPRSIGILSCGKSLMQSTQKITVSAQLTQVRTKWSTAAVVLLLGVVALLPRVLGLVDFLTTDEVYNWMSRVERFSDAIARHQW